MDLLIALWLAISLPVALLGGRWIRSSDRSGVEEIEAYLRRLARGRRPASLPLARAGIVALTIVGSLLLVSTAVARHLPPVEVVTRPGAFAFGPFRPTSSTTSLPETPASVRPSIIITTTTTESPQEPSPPAPPATTSGEPPAATADAPAEGATAPERPPDQQPSDADGLAWMADPTASWDPPGDAAPPDDHEEPDPAAVEDDSTTTTSIAPTSTTTTTTKPPAAPG